MQDTFLFSVIMHDHSHRSSMYGLTLSGCTSKSLHIQAQLLYRFNPPPKKNVSLKPIHINLTRVYALLLPTIYCPLQEAWTGPH